MTGSVGADLLGERRSDPRALRPRAVGAPRQRHRSRPGSAAPCPGWPGRAGRTPPAAPPGRRGRPAENISGIRSRFSSPMPCSPLSTPPAATDAAHDLLAGGVRPAPSRRARARRTRSSGWRLPSPAWNTLSTSEVVAARRSRRPAPAPPGSSCAGHDGVVEVVVRLDPGDRAERRLAALPQQRPLGLVGGDAHVAHAVRRWRSSTIGAVSAVDAVRQADDLDQQGRRGVDRQPGVDVRLDGLQAELVHHLQRRRHDPRGDDRADRRRPGLDRCRSPSASCATAGGSGVSAHAHLGGDAEHPLAADEHAAQVVAGRLGILAAEHGHRAVGQHDLEGEDVRVR